MSGSTNVMEKTEKKTQKSTGKRVIGVVSGRRGAGKSLVAAVLAVKMNRRGYNVAVLDADIDQPTANKMFGLHDQDGVQFRVFPQSSGGIQVVTVAALLQERPADQEIKKDTLRHCADDMLWTDLEVMLVDMPWGMGPETRLVIEAAALDGMLLVTSPQELVSITVSDAVCLAKETRVPLLGIVENMSYAMCPQCGRPISVLGESHLGETAEKHGLRVLDKIPVEPRAARLCCMGRVCDVSCDWLENTADAVLMCGY